MNSDKLNSIIKKRAKRSNDMSLHLHQMFFFEHVLMRLAVSKYKDNVILKGGVLLSSIIGNDMRTTKDIDATLKSIPLNINTIEKIFNEILSIELNDGVKFKIESIKDTILNFDEKENIKDIRLEDAYGGFRINVFATFDKLKTNFFLEVTTGDIITPREINYKYKSLFEDETINIMTYTVETIISEKFESIISKNIHTTRSKDFYDLYMLMIKNKDKINKENLIKAIENTFKHRNTNFNIDYLKDLTNEPKSTYCNILKEAQQKCLKTIERLTPWRDATFYTFIIMDVLYLILLLFGK